MDYRSAMKEMNQGRALPIYVCFGTETFLMQEFLSYTADKLIDPQQRPLALSSYDLNETSLDVVLDDVETMPFLTDKKVVIAHHAAFFTGTKSSSKIEHPTERLIDYIKDSLEHAILIFTVESDKLDERKKLVKSLRDLGSLIPFSPLSPEESIRWIKNRADRLGVSFAEGGMDAFILNTGPQLQFLATELEKLAIYVGIGGRITTELIDELVVRSTEQNVFILIDEIVRLRLDKALTIFYELLKQREEPVKILLMIARQFRIILQTKELLQQGNTQRQIAAELNIHPYRVKLAAEQSANFSITKLSQIISQIADLDYQMKSGRIEKPLGLELLIVGMAQ